MSECEVTLEDQTLINRFARLNAKCEELEADLELKKRQLSNCEEALNELLIQDTVLVQCGELFAQMGEEGATQWCEDIKRGLETGVAEISSRVLDMKQEMTAIKARLYAKFGQNINLEYDEQ